MEKSETIVRRMTLKELSFFYDDDSLANVVFGIDSDSRLDVRVPAAFAAGLKLGDKVYVTVEFGSR